jgi:bifunctional non-homologous end joining protein LigD
MRYRPQNAEPLKGSIDALFMRPNIMEPKYDGIRLLAEVNADGVATYTRTGNSQTGKLPEIEADLLANFPVGTVLDCEAVAFTVVDGVVGQEWGGAQSVLGSGVKKAQLRSKTITLVVFDMLEYNGLDIRPLPFSQRRAALQQVFDKADFKYTILTPQMESTQDNYDALVEAGYEGAMVKDTTRPYASGIRGGGWTKLKATDEADVVIMGFKEGESSFKGMIGAVEFGQYKDGVLTYRGRCSGMDLKMRQEMTAKQTQLIGSVISVAYMTIMPSGALRHPQYKRFRFDKPAEDCVWQ